MITYHSGKETLGAIIAIGGKQVQLPPDAFIQEYITEIDCQIGSACSKAPVYVIARGKSTVWLSEQSGQAYFWNIVPTEPRVFDFLKGTVTD